MKKLFYLINKGFVLFKRNLTFNFISTLTISTVLFIYFVFFLVSYSANKFFVNMSKIQTVRAYIAMNNKENVNNLIADIRDLKSVENVVFYSNSDTYKYINENMKSITYIGKLPEELFPSFIEITLAEEYRNIDYVRDLESTLNDLENVDSVSYGEKWILNFLTIRFGVELFTTIITILLSISIASIIYNTVKLNLIRYKKEIKIYSLVGATRTFITVPFLFSTIIEAIISFFAAYGVVFFIFKILDTKILKKLSIDFLSFPPLSIFMLLFICALIIIIASSYLSINTFLDYESSFDE